MRAIVLTAVVAAAAVLVSPTPGDRVVAMGRVGSSAPDVGAADTPARQPAVVCGSKGCARMHTSRVQRHRPRP